MGVNNSTTDRMFDNKVLRTIFGSKREQVTGGGVKGIT
jgi:hypothetical protein